MWHIQYENQNTNLYTNFSGAPQSESEWDDVVCGQNYKTNAFFIQNKDALKLHLYSDVVNISNPLGASKTKHKILMVYWTLLDFPKEYRSKSDSFFIALSAREKQSKLFEEDLFRPLLQDLQDLEAGIVMNGVMVKAGIVLYSGDNLESHTIGGFQTHFNSGYICRFCEMQHKDLQLPLVDECPLWTKEKYDTIALRFRPERVPDINFIESTPQDLLMDEITTEEILNDDEAETPLDEVADELATEERCGLRKPCLFNTLQSFHAVTSLPPDAFHDVVEGGVSIDILEMLRSLIKRKVFSLAQFNDRLQSINYTFSDASDIPSPLTKNCEKLPGKGVANMVFIRLLPFLLNPWSEDSRNDSVIQVHDGGH